MTMARNRDRQAQLGEFESGALPPRPTIVLDQNTTTIRAPDGGGKIAGYTGVPTNRDGRAYVSYKTRGTHLYRAADGYAISKAILRQLVHDPVHSLFWVEKETGACYEFSMRQYVEDAERVKHSPSTDPQVVVPNREARHIWFDIDPVVDTRRQE